MAAAHLSFQQTARLERFGVERCVDLHCHCLPGVDDGPPTVADALGLCRMLVRDGFTDVVATPHELGRWDGTNWAATIRQGVARMQDELAKHGIPLTIHAGAEVRIDERIPRLLAADQVLTLADTRKFLLLELPTAMTVRPDTAMRILAGKDETAARPSLVLAHAERYESLIADHQVARGWVEQGVALQVNASSLVGPTNSEPNRTAWTFLGNGWVSLVATDAHSTGSRRPRMSEAIDLIAARFGETVAKRLCVDNPLSVLEGGELPKVELPAAADPSAGAASATGAASTADAPQDT